jgi:hypothetical protein
LALGQFSIANNWQLPQRNQESTALRAKRNLRGVLRLATANPISSEFATPVAGGTASGRSAWPATLTRLASNVYLAGFAMSLPILPLLASVVFLRPRFLWNYRQTLKKCAIHLAAMREGPALHYFGDVAGRAKQVPEQIGGSCVQCGNCCMEHRCMFLEEIASDKYQCGIYHSYWRRFSNCGSFPLNRHDIERYACPSYYVVTEKPVVFVKPERSSLSAVHSDE